MVIFEKILSMISSFISISLPWSVVVLIIFLVYFKTVKKVLKKLTVIEINKDSSRINLTFKFLESIFAQKDGQKRQINKSSAVISEGSDPLKLEILRIYSGIETAVKKKFGVTDIYEMLDLPSNKGKIDNTTIILLTSMEYLRDQIISSSSPKIIKENIIEYKRNADRIIKIIQDIED